MLLLKNSYAFNSNNFWLIFLSVVVILAIIFINNITTVTKTLIQESNSVGPDSAGYITEIIFTMNT